MGASDFGGERKDVDGWWWSMENHVPHADEHKLDFALFLDFSINVPKSSTVIRKVQFRFNRVDVKSWKVTSSAPYYGNPQNGAVGSDYGMYPSIYISKFESWTLNTWENIQQ